MPDRNNDYGRLTQKIATLREKLAAKQARRLNLAQLDRAVRRLIEYADACAECRSCLDLLPEQLERMENTSEILARDDFRAYHLVLKRCLSHLETGHKLIHEGYYANLYMSLGLCLGLPFGLLFENNIALGLPIGMCIGLAVGSGLDADAKKKGRVI